MKCKICGKIVKSKKAKTCSSECSYKNQRNLSLIWRKKYRGRTNELARIAYNKNIEKSKSNNLRFMESNLIPLCYRCHSLHHQFGDAKIHAEIMAKRGIGWWNKLKAEYENKKQYWTKKDLENIIKMYEIQKGTASVEQEIKDSSRC